MRLTAVQSLNTRLVLGSSTFVRNLSNATTSSSPSGASSSASAVSVAATNRRETADLLVERADSSTRFPTGSSPQVLRRGVTQFGW